VDTIPDLIHILNCGSTVNQTRQRGSLFPSDFTVNILKAHKAARCGRKVLRVIYLPKILFLSNIKIVPMGSYTPMVAALEVFNRYGLQHVFYTLLDVYKTCPEMTSLIHF
jgi:hypothetical protein